MNRIKIILFDFDGVMVNRFTELSVNDFCIAYNVNQSDFARISKEASIGLDIGQKSELNYFAELVKNLSLKVAPSEVSEFFAKSDEKNIRKNEYLYQWLDKIITNGIIVGLATNVSKELAERLRNMGLYNIFQKQYLSHEIGVTKTDKKFWQYVIDDLLIEPKRIAFLDDNQNNVDVAISMRIRSFAYHSFDQMLEQASSWVRK